MLAPVALHVDIKPQTLPLQARWYALPGAVTETRCLALDGHKLRLVAGDEVLAQIDGGQPFHLEVTCSPTDNELDIAVRVGQAGQVIAVRGKLAPDRVRADVAEQQSRAPWLGAADFRTFWLWVQSHAQLAGVDANQLTVLESATSRVPARAQTRGESSAPFLAREPETIVS